MLIYLVLTDNLHMPDQTNFCLKLTELKLTELNIYSSLGCSHHCYPSRTLHN